jgi:phosphatidylglycerol:prolipoprotein diacylglycerol transferase
MYGIIIATAILSCLFLGEYLIKKTSLNLNSYWAAMFWTILAGIIGARLYHVVEFAYYYKENLIEIFYVHRGGVGIYGAVFGGAIGLYLSLKKSGALKEHPFLQWMDLASVVIPLGQGIGRWGNFINKELFGPPTNLPWGIFIPVEHRPMQYINNDMFHPIFLYESLLVILLFSVLLALYKRKSMLGEIADGKKPLYAMNGFFTLTYFLGYGFIRFFMEFLRLNYWKFHGISFGQMISLIFISIGIFGLFSLNRKRA